VSGLGLALSNVGDANVQVNVMQSYGGRIADDAGKKVTIKSEETRTYLTWRKDACDKGIFPPGNTTWDGAGDNQAREGNDASSARPVLTCALGEPAPPRLGRCSGEIDDRLPVRIVGQSAGGVGVDELTPPVHNHRRIVEPGQHLGAPVLIHGLRRRWRSRHQHNAEEAAQTGRPVARAGGDQGRELAAHAVADDDPARQIKINKAPAEIVKDRRNANAVLIATIAESGEIECNSVEIRPQALGDAIPFMTTGP
jgi:hypothetical protein